MSKAVGYISTSMKLKAFNRVWMLHGVDLSDITAAKMRTIDRIFLTNSQFEGKHNNFWWLMKHHISPRDYTSWHQTLEFFFWVSICLPPLVRGLLNRILTGLITGNGSSLLTAKFYTSTKTHLPSSGTRFLRNPRSRISYFSKFLLVENETPSTQLHHVTRRHWLLIPPVFFGPLWTHSNLGATPPYRPSFYCSSSNPFNLWTSLFIG